MIHSRFTLVCLTDDLYLLIVKKRNLGIRLFFFGFCVTAFPGSLWKGRKRKIHALSHCTTVFTNDNREKKKKLFQVHSGKKIYWDLDWAIFSNMKKEKMGGFKGRVTALPGSLWKQGKKKFFAIGF